MKQLHPGAKWMFRIQGYLSFLILSAMLSVWTGILFSISIWMIAGIAIVLAVILGEIYADFSYRFWFYEFTKDQLRIERGIIWKRYSNIPYARVQNVDINRGIIARILGFSSVNVQTAGFSAPARQGQWAEGYIPAVSKDEGEKIREFLMKKISRRGI